MGFATNAIHVARNPIPPPEPSSRPSIRPSTSSTGSSLRMNQLVAVRIIDRIA